MSESELERELHRRRQDLARKLLQGHRDQRSPKEAAGPAEDTSGVECSEPREHESHAETASGTMQVVGLGCARRGHDGLHRLDAALNLLPERYLVEMRRRVTIATASRAPPRTPWKPPWYIARRMRVPATVAMFLLLAAEPIPSQSLYNGGIAATALLDGVAVNAEISGDHDDAHCAFSAQLLEAEAERTLRRDGIATRPSSPAVLSIEVIMLP